MPKRRNVFLQKDSIEADLEDGLSLRDIGDKYGCAKSTVSTFCKKHGIEVPSVGAKKGQRPKKRKSFLEEFWLTIKRDMNR